jgi:uncharacterized protein with FMN-binding domain
LSQLSAAPTTGPCRLLAVSTGHSHTSATAGCLKPETSPSRKEQDVNRQTHATYTSEAFIGSLQEALAKAKAA